MCPMSSLASFYIPYSSQIRPPLTTPKKSSILWNISCLSKTASSPASRRITRVRERVRGNMWAWHPSSAPCRLWNPETGWPGGRGQGPGLRWERQAEERAARLWARGASKNVSKVRETTAAQMERSGATGETPDYLLNVLCSGSSGERRSDGVAINKGPQDFQNIAPG